MRAKVQDEKGIKRASSQGLPIAIFLVLVTSAKLDCRDIAARTRSRFALEKPAIVDTG